MQYLLCFCWIVVVTVPLSSVCARHACDGDRVGRLVSNRLCVHVDDWQGDENAEAPRKTYHGQHSLLGPLLRILKIT